MSPAVLRVLAGRLQPAAVASGPENLSIFAPASPDAQAIVDLAILALAVTAIIFLLVEAILFYTVWRFRQRAGEPGSEPAQVYGSQPIEVAWTAAPALIVFFLTLVITRTLWEKSAELPATSAGAARAPNLRPGEDLRQNGPASPSGDARFAAIVPARAAAFDADSLDAGAASRLAAGMGGAAPAGKPASSADSDAVSGKRGDARRGGPAVSQQADVLDVTVVGHQWWWEFVYTACDGRELGFVTANELHVPASRSDAPRQVVLRLESADVCHSFWVPRLAGKVDLIPGRTNQLVFEPRQEGVFLGQCAEYCGTQHAGMLLRVVVEPADAFATWLAGQMRPAVDDPSVRDGRDAFLSESCVNCHRVRGTAAAGTFGPDLTHLMSRRTIAAGLLGNTPQGLDRWIHDPQTVKPGVLMPAFALAAQRQAAIVRYLQTLR